MNAFGTIVSRAATVAAVLFGSLCPGEVLAANDAPATRATPGAFVQVNEAKIYYEECGTAPQTVVLIHDGGSNSAVWDEVWPEFCRHFRTIRYDRRGYGRSPEATSWYYETDDLAALLRHLPSCPRTRRT
jgi:3-oxoadipate enol-lactonase